MEFILLKKYFKRSLLSTEKDEMNRMKKNAGKSEGGKDRGQMTEGRRRRAENRDQRTEDGGRTTEDGGRRTEDIPVESQKILQ